jgi:hypothetical protein
MSVTMVAIADFVKPDLLLEYLAEQVGEHESAKHRQLVRAACACAETALVYVPHDEPRPAALIALARGWADGSEGDIPVIEAADALSDAADQYEAENAEDAISDAYASAVCAAGAIGEPKEGACAASYALFAYDYIEGAAYYAAKRTDAEVYNAARAAHERHLCDLIRACYA